MYDPSMSLRRALFVVALLVTAALPAAVAPIEVRSLGGNQPVTSTESMQSAPSGLANGLLTTSGGNRLGSVVQRADASSAKLLRLGAGVLLVAIALLGLRSAGAVFAAGRPDAVPDVVPIASGLSRRGPPLVA
jgi:hypothetical protein